MDTFLTMDWINASKRVQRLMYLYDDVCKYLKDLEILMKAIAAESERELLK